MFLFLILYAFVIWTLLSTKEPENFTRVKEMYRTFIDHIRENNTDPRFSRLKNETVLVAYRGRSHEIGYNTNKGYEIGLCIDGDPNQIFHVLLHELAHCTVDDYEHNSNFWKNFNDLKTICAKIGLYQMIPQKEKFCGKHIQDI
tara:strand:- start:14185 stop:14616 length:432 start_codon:yes stop_codon:yes gene_type:complete